MTRRLRGWVAPVLGIAGLVLCVRLFVHLGPAEVGAHVRRMGPVLPLVLLLTGMKLALQTAGWRLALLPHERPAWPSSVAATLSGDALGYITWAGPFTGEPARAFLLRATVPIGKGTAAGVVERGLYNITAFVLVGLVFLALASPALAFAAVGVALLAAALAITRGRRSPHASAPAHATETARATPSVAKPSVRRALKDFWRQRREVLVAIAALAVLQHLLLVLEAWTLLGEMNANATMGAAAVFEAATKVVNAVGTIVPARLGISEGGSAMLAAALGFAAREGFSLALMRRIRALIWAVAGLALLPVQEWRERRLQAQAAAASSARSTGR